MLWLKAFHIVFMVSWFAGLFYLPRLFVYHAQANDPVGIERFVTMERRLFAIMTIAAIGTLFFGLWLLATYPAYMRQGWLHAKLLLVVLLMGYHLWFWILCRRFRAGTNQHGQRFYRWINEIPALFLFFIVILAVVRPF